MLTRSDRQDEHTVLRDRSFIEEMKADILRRAEAISDDEDEAEIGLSSTQVVAGMQKAADEDDIDLDDDIKRLGAVGDAGDVSDEEGVEGREAGPSPETILELAYIRDPKLFDRDAQTRRSKTRIDLRAQTGSFAINILTGKEYRLMHGFMTGWDDNQIEGWRIMLERNVRSHLSRGTCN
jgi:activating signal cointegrator complex subunit 2